MTSLWTMKQKVSPYYRTKRERTEQNKMKKSQNNKAGWFRDRGYSSVLRVDPTPGLS